jgi:hypothetical protein
MNSRKGCRQSSPFEHFYRHSQRRKKICRARARENQNPGGPFEGRGWLFLTLKSAGVTPPVEFLRSEISLHDFGNPASIPDASVTHQGVDNGPFNIKTASIPNAKHPVFLSHTPRNFVYVGEIG